ncbi:MAG: phage tail sheath subtilisin-like domain-containing protein [Deltaproteobacteria bacterium]|nr:phage tail sheath subtilisin-like domain-containing protein [Deltaproteobacteria bacterium]
MAETYSTAEFVIPGTYVRVRAEGLISAGGISTGNLGVVGTAQKVVDAVNVVDYAHTYNLSDYESAVAQLGAYDAFGSGAKLHLTRVLELLYQNGARTVYARPLNLGASDSQPGRDAYTAAFNELVKDDVNLLVAPQLSTADALAVLGPVLETAENNGKDVIAVVGADAANVAAIAAQVPTNDRIIFCTPGVRAYDAALKQEVALPGPFAAAAVAGLISTLTPEASPTNKVLPGVVKLASRYSYGETKQLVNARALVLEERGGVRVVRGLTSDDAAFRQITTRRIVDFAKAGIRKSSDPFIGRLNNQRVRKALYGAIDGFLTTMVVDEQLVSYTLQVTASRQDEIAGRALVNAVLLPTFSIDFIAVTLVLQ